MTLAIAKLRPNLVPIGGEGTARDVPSEFRLFAHGENVTDKGTFLFDDRAAEMVMSAYAAHGTPLMFDYEHMSLSDPPIVAPAAATEFVPEVRNGELWATQIKWTDRAREMLAAGEYRLFSPAFRFERDSGRVTALINVALTNNPAMHGIAPLVAASNRDPEKEPVTMSKPMKCTGCKVGLRAPSDDADGDEMYCVACKGAAASQTRVMSIVGLRADASDETFTATLTALHGLRTQICTLTGKADVSEAVGVIQAWQRDAKDAGELRGKLETLSQKSLAEEARALLDGAEKDKKIVGNPERAFWESAAKSGGERFTEAGVAQLRGFLEVAQPKVIKAEQPTTVETGVAALTAGELEVCAKTGVKPEDFAKSKAAKLAARGGAAA